MRVFVELISDFVNGVSYFIKDNLRNLATLLNIFLPYIMYFLGQYVFNQRNKIAVGTEILIPIGFAIIIYLIRSYANKIGKGTTIPLPVKRFTQVDDNEEVTVEYNRLQELILYTADLEDWLQRKGLL